MASDVVMLHSSLNSVVHSVAFACFGMGFNTGIIAGGLLYLQAYFPTLKADAILNGAVTASVFLGACLANLIVAPLADRFGRVPIMQVTQLPFLIGAVAVALAEQPEFIVFGRFITGLAVGAAGSLPNLYIAEIAPPESRGAYVAKAPLYGTFGIMIAQFASFGVAIVLGEQLCSQVGWRIMFLFGAVPSILQLFWARGIPESPRWCCQRGLDKQAHLNNHLLANLEDGTEIVDFSPTLSEREGGLNLGQAALAVGLSVMQQLSGVNAVIFYAPFLYAELGVSRTLAIFIAGCNSVAQVLATRLMTQLIDPLGRRPMCFIGLIGMFLGLVSLGAAVNRILPSPIFFAVGGVLLFRISFSLSLGPLPYVILTELFPQHQRAKGVSLSMTVNWLLNWVVVLILPILYQLGSGAVFYGFALVCVVSLIIVDFALPETAGRDLSELESSQQSHQGVLARAWSRLITKNDV